MNRQVKLSRKHIREIRRLLADLDKQLEKAVSQQENPCESSADGEIKPLITAEDVNAFFAPFLEDK
jgi:hypothetical protein